MFKENWCFNIPPTFRIKIVEVCRGSCSNAVS